MNRDYEEDIIHAARLLQKARHAIALTGAGMSTPSGIPDFRSPGIGLWENANPMEVASIYAFRSRPEAFYAWIRPLVEVLLDARPNPGHTALAELEAQGCLKATITQNIDALHQEAGSREVLELHGHMREAVCIDCYEVMPTAELLENFLATGEIPRCPVCNGVMKPNAVLFGEQLPIKVVNAAMMHIAQADLILVAGSSLEVLPASHLPLRVHEHEGQIIIVNLTSTYIDRIAEVVIHANVADALPLIAQAYAGR